MLSTEPKEVKEENSLEKHFITFRENTLGLDHSVNTQYGEFPLVYADWIAEGRMYGPIEEKLKELGPYIANPHSYSSYTGQQITDIYKESRKIIKDHVNASENDVLVTVGHGMTGALERLVHILYKRFHWNQLIAEDKRPVVFITHMEHHSNHTTWLQSGADVVVVPCNDEGLVCPKQLRKQVEKYTDRELIIGSFTSCSNVTGIISDYHALAEVMHEFGGYCFVDFAASAPYVNIDMHPASENQKLDAIFFSPHKFLGGPGTCGVLIFDSKLHMGEPSFSGGGNVKYTAPGGEYGHTSDIEQMEDGGTPGYIQTIKAALSVVLKEEMGVENIKQRESDLLGKFIKAFDRYADMEMIECDRELPKIGVVSFNIKDLHYNLVVRLLNDRFGIQTRGGWSCASNYAYHLFHFDPVSSGKLVNGIAAGNMTGKPGWVRISLHPTMTEAELDYCIDALHQIIENKKEWAKDYHYNIKDNEYYPEEGLTTVEAKAESFFTL